MEFLIDQVNRTNASIDIREITKYNSVSMLIDGVYC